MVRRAAHRRYYHVDCGDVDVVGECTVLFSGVVQRKLSGFSLCSAVFPETVLVVNVWPPSKSLVIAARNPTYEVSSSGDTGGRKDATQMMSPPVSAREP